MNNKKAYQEALDYVYSYINFSLTRNLRYSEEMFNLSRMKELMDLIGNPHFDYEVIHVAGTKGKGSTSAMIASILSEAGYKVGLYSSPHMVDLRERIKVDDTEITENEFIESLEIFKWAIEKVKNISTFEIITGLAFNYFSQKNIEIAVVEVGMGGRLDATNIVDPLISVITSISLDHTKILGNTIQEIAQEKAGIIKKGIPVVVSKQTDEALKSIYNIAKNKNSHVINVELIYEWRQTSCSLKFQEFEIIEKGLTENKNRIAYRLPLIGDHQLDNALTAYAVINELREVFNIPITAVKTGFAKVNWPGRFEVVNNDPLVIIDGAHNPDSFLKLSETIKKYLPGKYITLVFGASEDKNIKKMIQIIRPYANEIIFTKSDHPRALNEIEMRSKLKKVMNNFQFSEIERIPQFIRENKHMTFIVAGSIFTASAVKQLLKTDD